MSRFKKISKWIGVALVVAFVAIQFVPVARTNPPVETEVVAPPEVRALLRRACYDCHSNETVWPWYSRIAPISWLVSRDVELGRGEFNFSTWNRLDAKRQEKIAHECYEEASEGEMPPWFYLLPHPEARLSKADLEVLRGWSGSTEDAHSDED